MSKETKKWWEEMSSYYQKESKIPIDIHYGPGAPNESVMNLLGNLKRKKILEIGCGGAQCSIAMAKLGAIVTAIDISKEQLKFARNLAEKNNVKIKFYQGDIKNLHNIKTNSQDIIFSAWALMYVNNLKSCFKEVYRVLKKRGIFIFSIPHPFYFSINPKTLRLRRSYFNVGKYIKEEKGKDGKIHKFVMYPYTINGLYDYLVASEFKIEKIIEPDSRKKYKGDPWYGLWEFKPKLMVKVPPTIIFKARKI